MTRNHEQGKWQSLSQTGWQNLLHWKNRNMPFFTEKLGSLGTIMLSMIVRTFVTTWNSGKTYYQPAWTVTKHFVRFRKFGFLQQKQTFLILTNLVIGMHFFIQAMPCKDKHILHINKVPTWIVFEKTQLTKCAPWQKVPRSPLLAITGAKAIMENTERRSKNR